MRSNDWSNKEKVGRWLSARPTRNPVVEYLRDNFDFGSIYGSTLSCLFGIADYLQDYAAELIPADWEYTPAMGGSDTEAWEYEAITEAVAAGATIQDVLQAGIVFNRLDRLNRLTGLEY